MPAPAPTEPHPGLTEAQARARLAEVGPNELPEGTSSVWRVALRQLDSVLVWILLGALVLSAVIGHLEGGEGWRPYIDAIVIGVILVLNFVFGFAQEFAAERAISALRRLSAPHARVRRDGSIERIPAREVVPGDVVLLEAGDLVPADGQLLEAAHLRVDESALTGESLDVTKAVAATDAIAADAPLAERSDRLFSSSLLTRGSAEMRVEATGLSTEVGRIAAAVGRTETPTTPLQDRLAQLGRTLGIAVVGISAVIGAVGLVRGEPLLEVLLVGVSLAVSAVPEGLPAVVTVCFALGVREMAGRNALVRRLDSLETLGAVTVICTDKTGTLTENRMAVAQTWIARDGDGPLLDRIGVSCNRASLPDLGEPTELALLRYGTEQGAPREAIDHEEIPFTSESKCMQTRHGDRSYLKGAPVVIAQRCGGPDAAAMLEEARALGDEGLRVLAGAVVEQGEARVVGLWALSDPPRDGTPEAIAAAARAGVRTVMITGDAPRTALAIAGQVGLEHTGVLTGADLDALEETERDAAILRTRVFARVAPLHKLLILRTLEQAGEVVAMTGDGVNDAPALRGAHVGVAMGKRGTEVARAAASIILADDHYATIVGAIAEGRRIHDNIRRFVLYMLRANFDELLLVLAAFLFGLPLPLLPAHILWLNLLTDGPPALAMAAEGPEADVMERPPRPRDSHLLSGEWGRLVWAGLVTFSILLGLFVYSLDQGATPDRARSATVTLGVMVELLLALSARTKHVIWRSHPWKNLWLLGAVTAVFCIHVALLYSPLASAFRLEALSLEEWTLLVPLALLSIGLVELGKVVGGRSR